MRSLTATGAVKRPVLAAAVLLAALLVAALLGGYAGTVHAASLNSANLAEAQAAHVAPVEDDIDDDVAAGYARPWDIRVHGPVTSITESVTDTLTVNGKTVLVDAATWVKAQGALTAGSWVQVKGVVRADGTVYATSIQWVHRVPDKTDGLGGPTSKFTLMPTSTPAQAPNIGKGKAPGMPPGKDHSRAPGAGQGQGQRDRAQDEGHAGQGNANGKGHK